MKKLNKVEFESKITCRFNAMSNINMTSRLKPVASHQHNAMSHESDRCTVVKFFRNHIKNLNSSNSMKQFILHVAQCWGFLKTLESWYTKNKNMIPTVCWQMWRIWFHLHNKNIFCFYSSFIFRIRLELGEVTSFCFLLFWKRKKRKRVTLLHSNSYG